MLDYLCFILIESHAVSSGHNRFRDRGRESSFQLIDIASNFAKLRFNTFNAIAPLNLVHGKGHSWLQLGSTCWLYFLKRLCRLSSSRFLLRKKVGGQFCCELLRLLNNHYLPLVALLGVVELIVDDWVVEHTF